MQLLTSMNRFLICLLFLAPAAFAQGTLEVISLRHRTAEQVIPVLRPLLEPGGALSGQYNQLIVRTSPANLAQIRTALDAIDQPARRLTISVRFDNAEEASRSGIQTDARISSRGSSADVRVLDSRSARDERVDQRIQVLEGGRAMIASGQSRPLRQRQVIQTPSGPVVQETTVIQGAATGFEVVPRVSGGNVFLEIAPQREQFAPGPSGAIQSERLASTVSGRLGEWIELGGASSSASRSGSGILSSRDASASSDRRVWVKVEELR
jgi:type II secretory pathway component GspD/PulD (secretin)